MENIVIWEAKNLVSEIDYLNSTKRIVTNSIKNDPTLVLHDDETILKRYDHSIVVIRRDWVILWNTSIYPTEMVPLDNVASSWTEISVWECGSTVIDLENRCKWLGKMMISEAVSTLWNRYCVLIAATINPLMVEMRKWLGFEEWTFPKKYYEEWLKYLSPKLEWWESEFRARANFLLKFNNLEFRDYILTILKNQ